MMILRSITYGALAIAAVAVTPAQAQQTFDAWGHTFNVPGGSASVSVAPTPRRYNDLVVAAPASAAQRAPNAGWARINARSR